MKLTKKYFFICGCARSGTTALWKLMTAHPEVVVGMERFAGLVQHKFDLSDNLFNKDRFFDLYPNDTFYNDLYVGIKGVYYKEVAQRYDKALIYGDKIPSLYNHYKNLNSAFPDVKIIFIYRNIFDVAASFNERAAKAINWPATRDYKVAIDHWNKSLQSTLHYIKSGGNVLCLEYEKLLWGGVDVELILNFFELKSYKSFDAKLNFLINKNKEFSANKIDNLTADQKRYIILNSDFQSYKNLIKLSSI